jgi:hypothetical protein
MHISLVGQSAAWMGQAAPSCSRRTGMAPESIDRLGKITTEPAPQEVGPDAERTKAAEKAVAMGKVKDPQEAAIASAADRDRGSES